MTKKRIITVRLNLTEEAISRLRTLAQSRGISVTELIREAVEVKTPAPDRIAIAATSQKRTDE